MRNKLVYWSVCAIVIAAATTGWVGFHNVSADDPYATLSGLDRAQIDKAQFGVTPASGQSTMSASQAIDAAQKAFHWEGSATAFYVNLKIIDKTFSGHDHIFPHPVWMVQYANHNVTQESPSGKSQLLPGIGFVVIDPQTGKWLQAEEQPLKS